MAASSLGPKEAGFLDVATYTLSIILLFFLVVSLAFERGTHWLIRFFKKRKRNGLAQAVSDLVLELTLVGLVSLLLIVLQDPIASICAPYSSGAVSKWSLISNVPGCDCCLADTSTVGSCFLNSRECGYNLCNCDAQNSSCLVEAPSLLYLLDEWNTSSGCPVSECSLNYLKQAEGSPEVAQARESLKLECDGMVAVQSDLCGEGKSQIITITALHQVHIFIFTVAMTHVFMGVVMILLATWRLSSWRRLCGDDEDEHARGVRRLLNRSPSQQEQHPSTKSWARLINSRLLRRVNTVPARRNPGPASSPLTGAGSPAASPGSPNAVAAAAAAAAAAENGTSAPAVGVSPARGVSLPANFAAELPAFKQAPPDSSASKQEDSSNGSSSVNAKPTHTSSSSTSLAADQAAAEAGQQAKRLPRSNSTGSDLGGLNGSRRVTILESVASREFDNSMLPGAEPAAASTPTLARKSLLSRSKSIKQGDYAGWAQEYVICFLHLFIPRPVSAEQLRLMRASFMLSHRVPEGFDFWTYINLSMEDDFSQIVGVSLEMWITLVVFVLISGVLGWAAMLFVILSALVLIAINLKLFMVFRHVCRGEKVNQLSSHVFWFNRPQILLHPIKYLLFLCSFMFASAIFFLWSFGAHSCPFTNAFWFAWLPPWWVLLILSGLIFFDAAFRTLPCYSLAVQMGSDFKHHMLPTGIKNRLLKIAEMIKKKHKAQQAAAQAAEGSKRGGVLGGAQKIVEQLKPS